MTRKLIPIIVILVFVGGLVLGGYQYVKAQKASLSTVDVQTVPVTRGTLATDVLATGSVRTYQSANLSWQTGGTVAQVNVKAGDSVTAGQVLAALDPNSLSSSQITAQANLDSAQKALDDLLNTQSTTLQAKQAVDNAQQALDDYNASFPVTQAITYTQVISAQQAVSTTQNHLNDMLAAQPSPADLEAANQRYNAALTAVNIAQAAYDQVMQNKLPKNDNTRQAALNNLNNARAELNLAFNNLNWYMSKPSAQDIAQEQAALAQARAALAQAQSSWNQAKTGPDPIQIAMLQAKLADAQRAYDEVKNGPAASDVIAARANVAAAQAAVNQAKIIAPFDGKVSELDVLPGDVVSKTLALRLDNSSQMLVDVQISEVDIDKISTGQAAKLTFDAIPGKTYTGTVTSVDMVGAATQGVIQYGVTVAISNPDDAIKPGMTAAVGITTQEKSGVLIVPNQAIHNQSGQKYVLVLSGKDQLQVPVTVGLTNQTSSEVSGQGLREGDRVVVPGRGTK